MTISEQELLVLADNCGYRIERPGRFQTCGSNFGNSKLVERSLGYVVIGYPNGATIDEIENFLIELHTVKNGARIT